MKKTLSLLLALLVLGLPALAPAVQVPSFPGLGSDTEPAELALLEDSLLVYEGVLGLSGTYTALIENKSGFLAYAMSGTLEGLDKDGAVLFSQNVYAIYPNVIPAGGKAMVQGLYLQITPEQQAALVSWRLALNGEKADTAYYPEPILLPITAEYTQEEVQDLYSGTSYQKGSLLAALKNETSAPVFDAVGVVLLRDQEGKLIASQNNQLLNVGLPAGGEALLKMDVPRELLAYLAAQGRELTSVEAFAFSIPESTF